MSTLSKLPDETRKFSGMFPVFLRNGEETRKKHSFVLISEINAFSSSSGIMINSSTFFRETLRVQVYISRLCWCSSTHCDVNFPVTFSRLQKKEKDATNEEMDGT